MASGLLTGTMTRERVAKLPEDDWRRNSPEFREPKLSKNLELVERLKKVAVRYNTIPGAIAIAWTLRLPAVTGAIVGARNAKQAEEVMHAGEIKLTSQDIAEIEGVTAQAAR
jgi:aryl-alcohol dehydrogenase-like predicted oxidoreductase